MIGAFLFVTALLQGAAPQMAARPDLAAHAAMAQAPVGTIEVRAGVYNLDQFRAELQRAAALIESGSETAGLEALDRLATLSSEVRRVRNLTDVEWPAHSQLFVDRANGYLLSGNDKVEESLRELLRVDPQFKGTLAPRLQAVFDGLIQRETGTLEIESAVLGASLRVNGYLVGLAGDLATPVRLLQGEVEVRAQKDGLPRDGVTRQVVLVGQTIRVRITPSLNVPPVVLVSDRQDIAVTMSGSPIKFTNLSGLRAALPSAASQELDRRIAMNGLDANAVAGYVIPDDQIQVGRNLNVTATGTCLVDLTRTISFTEQLLKDNESAPLLWLGNDGIIRPQPNVGTLRVNSTPSGAQVFVSVPGVAGADQAVGTTPVDLQRCAGQYNVRVRHPKVGSFATAAMVRFGQTNTVEVPLKPGVAFLGAVDATSTPRPAADLHTRIVQRATATLTTFRAAEQLSVPPEVDRWGSQSSSATTLVTALERNDTAQVTRLLSVATANFEAPLMVAAVRRAADNIEILFLWNEHAGVDRVRWSGQDADLDRIFRNVDAPVDAADLVYQNDIGIQFADTALPGTPILIVRRDDPNSALQVGEHIEAVEGTAMNAQGLAERVRQKKAGDSISLRVSNVTLTQPRDVRITVGRKARRAPVFDPALQGNVLIAKLSAAAAGAPAGEARDLFTFSLGAAYLRFGEYKVASDLLADVGNVPSGFGVGRGAAAYLKARAFEALGQRDAALAAFREAAAVRDQSLADDGATVGAIADRHLGVLTRTP